MLHAAVLGGLLQQRAPTPRPIIDEAEIVVVDLIALPAPDESRAVEKPPPQVEMPPPPRVETPPPPIIETPHPVIETPAPMVKKPAVKQARRPQKPPPPARLPEERAEEPVTFEAAVPSPSPTETPPLAAVGQTASVAEKPAPVPSPQVLPPQYDAAYLRNPAPAYPALSRRYREEGRVLLRVYVGESGAAERVELHASSGSPRLDRAALETVRRWRFVPARRDDQPVAAWVEIPIVFSLEG